MMKRVYSSTITAVMLMALLFATLTSCGGKDPKETAEEVVQAELDGDIEKLYGLLCQEDQEAVTMENFQKFYTIPVDLADALELIPEIKESIKVEKFASSVNGETATVTYFINLPDLANMGNLSMEDAKRMLEMKSNRLKDLPEDIQDKIKESVKKDGVPTKSYAKEMKLRREGDDWKVYMNLSNQIQGGTIKSVYHVSE